MKTAIDIIEKAKSYSLLSNEKHTMPFYIRSRKKLAWILRNIKPEMVIATAGTEKRCIIILDYSYPELKKLINERKNES